MAHRRRGGDKLTDIACRNAKKRALGDGKGLWLFPSKTGGSKSWGLRFTSPVTGRARLIGLGPYPDVSLVKAREKAMQLRKLIRGGDLDAEGNRLPGIDPLEREAERKATAKAAAAEKAAKAITFRTVAEGYIESHRAGWQSPDHLSQWQNSLRNFVYPVIGDLPVSAIDTGAVCRVLEAPVETPEGTKTLWHAKPETASRLRSRIELVLAHAVARGWRPAGDNPARWRGHLSAILPAKTKVAKVQHHAALPWREAGPFMAALRGADDVAAHALEFLILTAARRDEALGVTWGELDLKSATWTVPPERMKGNREHRVPLSDAALDLLRTLRPTADDKPGNLVFQRQRGAKLSHTALGRVIDRLGHAGTTTVHGFRSTFRDWCAEATNYPREIAEAALAHTNADKVELAYRRTDFFDLRRRLMADWAVHCGRIMPAEGAEVVPLSAGRRGGATQA